MDEFSQEFQNEIAKLLGPRYCWSLHTEPTRILMRRIKELQDWKDETLSAAEDRDLYRAFPP